MLLLFSGTTGGVVVAPPPVVKVGTGGLTLSGSAPVGIGVVGTGGLTMTGSAPVSVGVVGTGGLTISGSAPVSVASPPVVIVPSGGLTISGSAPVSVASGGGGGGGGGGTGVLPADLPVPVGVFSATFVNTVNPTFLYDFGQGFTTNTAPAFPYSKDPLTTSIGGTGLAPGTPGTKGWAAPFVIPAGSSLTLDLSALAGGTAPAGVTVSFTAINHLAVAINQAAGSGLNGTLGGDGTAGEWNGKLSAGATAQLKAGVVEQMLNLDGGWPVSSTGARLLKITNPNASAIKVVVSMIGS